jgi:heptosyltransferase II
VTTADRASIRRLVVRTPNWLGDAVLALPAIAAIRRHYSSAHLTIAAIPGVAALYREDTDARPDEVIELPSTAKAALAALRGGGFDAGVLFPNSFRSAWQLRSAGVRERWGYAASGRSVLLTRRPRRPRRKEARHQADYYRALVRRLGIDCGSELPALRPSPASLAKAKALLTERRVDQSAPVVVVAPGAAYGQAKQWPPERVADTLAQVLRHRGGTAVIVGAGHDRDAAREITTRLGDTAPDIGKRTVDLTGRTSIGALVGVAALADVFLSNDSGAMHVAAALGRPVVALFGPTDEDATRPLGDHDVLTAPAFCRPCLLRDCPIDHRCMKRITVDRVAAAVARRLPAATTA